MFCVAEIKSSLGFGGTYNEGADSKVVIMYADYFLLLIVKKYGVNKRIPPK
jgi:hypothetical protein